MINLITPLNFYSLAHLDVGDMITISGFIYTGRDAVLPKIVTLIEDMQLSKFNINLEGAVIFHTAVSPAGVGPTSSNKYDIESTIPILSKAGVKLHLGKGALGEDTIKTLDKFNSVYAVIPPVTALLNSKIIQKKVIAFPEEGMEAFHLLEVKEFPAIIAVIHGKSIYDKL